MKNISADNHITTLISAPPLPFMLHHYHCCYTSLLLLICCLLALYYGKYTIFFTLMLLARHHKFTKKHCDQSDDVSLKPPLSYHCHYTTASIPLPIQSLLLHWHSLISTLLPPPLHSYLELRNQRHISSIFNPLPYFLLVNYLCIKWITQYIHVSTAFEKATKNENSLVLLCICSCLLSHSTTYQKIK